jgi:D-3-phosphoglycerate dehydrogenase / 2-oxoglutarate reductase
MEPVVDYSLVIVADCDHPSIDIEKNVLQDTAREVRWLACRNEEEIIEQCRDARGILIQYAPMTRRVLERLPQCQTIVRYGVGVDTVDLRAASELGIKVSNVPDYGTNEVSDHALALMLCLTRKIAFANDRVKRGEWDFRLMHPVFRHQVQTVGIIGMGRIGGAMARKAHALGMRVIAYDPYVSLDAAPPFVECVALERLLAESDVVSVHCPLASDTLRMIDASALALMKPTAYLINTARGGIVDEDALEAALASRRLAGAAMDVLRIEPGAPQHPLFRHENFLGTPHMAWHSEESALELKRKAAEEVRRVLRGETPLYQVNRH